MRETDKERERRGRREETSVSHPSTSDDAERKRSVKKDNISLSLLSPLHSLSRARRGDPR